MRTSRGFSLSELMIVVAIIGILSLIGFPIFRTLVQKSRQTEAKNALAAISKLETGFFGEHSAYGNHLVRMGLSDLATTLEYYNVGFMGVTCNDNPNGFRPPVTTVEGSALNLSFPTYFTAGTLPSTKFVGANPGAQPSAGCLAGDVASDGQTFTAVANAIISLKAGNPVDGWSINEQGVLSNAQSGLK